MNSSSSSALLCRMLAASPRDTGKVFMQRHFGYLKQTQGIQKHAALQVNSMGYSCVVLRNYPIKLTRSFHKCSMSQVIKN